MCGPGRSRTCDRAILICLVRSSPQHAQPGPVLQRLRQVRRLDALAPCQIGNGARQPEHAVPGARRKLEKMDSQSPLRPLYIDERGLPPPALSGISPFLWNKTGGSG